MLPNPYEASMTLIEKTAEENYRLISPMNTRERNLKKY